jgi:hypothetical protein
MKGVWQYIIFVDAVFNGGDGHVDVLEPPFDIQFDQCGQVVDGLSKVHEFGIEVHFLNFGIGTYHGRWLLKEIGNTASGIKSRL